MRLNSFTPRRRRIAHITLGLDTGGQEKLLLEFARHADRRRFDLSFLSLTTAGKLGKDIEAAGWPVSALHAPDGFRPGIAVHVATWLRRWRPDAVHTHDNKPLIYGAAAARMAGVPCVVHMRHFARLASVSTRQTLLACTAARLVDSYVCVSQESARAAVREGISPRRVTTVWNGIDLDRFQYAGPNPSGPVVVVARLSPEKDIGTLVRALALAVEQQPSLRLEIAGEGPCRADLEQLAAELGLGSRVTFLGEVRDVAGLLARARLFVLPSLTEGISLTLLEALARGLPTIATRVGGNPEVVIDSQTGLLVPAKDPASLAHAILRLTGDLAWSLALGRAGRLRVEKSFAASRMVAAYESLYFPSAA